MKEEMPKEQYEFIYTCQRDMIANTNMTLEEAWDFGVRCWEMGLAKVKNESDLAACKNTK